jgi:hypothetical protein
VVGVNGSGKSSLLRAVYRTFRALRSRQSPSIPLTLAWDIAPSDETVTAFLHIPQHKDEKPYFVALKQVPLDAPKAYWERLTDLLKSDAGTVELVQKPDGEDPIRSSYDAEIIYHCRRARIRQRRLDSGGAKYGTDACCDCAKTYLTEKIRKR